MKILAFAASNSPTSINKQLVDYAIAQLQEIAPDIAVETLDVNDYEMPFYRPDREAEGGIPEAAQRFYQKIGESDALLISFAEHNGLFASIYKNLFDWASRINMKVYQDKPTLIMSTSPGPNGGGNVLGVATGGAPFFGMDIKGSLSVPKFQENFDSEQKRLTNPELQQQLAQALENLRNS